MEKTIVHKFFLGLILLSLLGCRPRNILVLPPEVGNTIMQGLPEQTKVYDERRELLYFQIEHMDNGSYTIILKCSTLKTTWHKRLIPHSGRQVLVGEKRYPLVGWEDEELSLLSVPKGEFPDFGGRFLFFDGLWVSWLGTKVTGSWLDEKQPTD